MKRSDRKDARTPESYVERDYRLRMAGKGLVPCRVQIAETDLQVMTTKADIDGLVHDLALQYRLQVERYIEEHPHFQGSLSPLALDELAPPLIQEMLVAGQKAGVGPMAAVAGSISEYVGQGLLMSGLQEVVVENGGDIFLKRDKDACAAIFAGESPLSYTVGVKIEKRLMPCGICTSSGTVGHSLSFGDADSVTVIARSTPLADAAATRLGNVVGRNRGGRQGLENALQEAARIEGLTGVVVICGELLGAVGMVELVKLQ